MAVTVPEDPAGGEGAIAAAIAAAVEAHPGRKVPLQDVLVAAASIERSAAAGVGWRGRVGQAIAALEAAGALECPRTRFDTTAEPRLPAYVMRPKLPAAEVASEPVIWHAELSWAAVADDAGELSAAERRFLATISDWLPRRRGVVVPVRERSLEIFGDEKTLEGWIGGRLFGTGRLDLDLLECEPCWPPVHQLVLGGGDWLVVENYTTYVSLSRFAESADFDGRVVWGSGNQVGTRLATLALELVDGSGQRPGAIRYFGDVDAGGFRVARSAVARAAQLDLGPVVPARGLYRLALDVGTAREVPGARPSVTTAEWAERWLGSPLGPRAGEVVASGQRIVQETVGAELLALQDAADRLLGSVHTRLQEP